MATQAERRVATRTRLIEVARGLFAREGYDRTPTERILEMAGLSRGAMYHHFATKRDVFEAVFVQVSDETIVRAVRRSPPSDSPLEDLIGACLAWLREVRRPDVAAILIDQGPQVLGWKRARDLEALSSLRRMTQGLERAIAAGEVRVPSVQLAARLINAALAEAALAALHREPRTSRATQEAAIRQLIEGLRSE